MNFVLDGMLGKLARWLRIMGHDAKYSNSLDDAELLQIAKAEGRVLLTRDFALYQQATAKNLQTYYVEGTTEPQRLAELANRFGLPLEIDLSLSRCPKCNTPIKPVSKEEVAAKVEKNTLNYYNEFWVCPTDGSVYWQGAHWTKIRITLEKAKKLKEEKKV